MQEEAQALDEQMQKLQDPNLTKGEVWLFANLNPNNPDLKLASQESFVSTLYLESLAKTLETILSTLIVSPQISLFDVNYINDDHERQIRKWSQAPDEPTDACIHDVIYERVLIHPEREAVCAWDGSLTYRDLWAHVQSLAHVLTDFGIGPESVVALCFEKSIWSTVAMLAVLEAGAAFCPLDPTQPTSRVQGLVLKLQARLVLCSRKFLAELSSVAERTLPIDIETFKSRTDVSLEKQSRAKPGNIAYVLWTSGSTGEPKGVVIEHRAYCSAAKSHAPKFRMKADSRVLQYASYVFDASILEVLTTLMVGATICVPDEDSRVNDLTSVVNQMRVDWAALTPSVASFFNPSLVPSLKSLLMM
ncbi:MAG: hypothetical protein Q9191_000894 [Dirinaria sp. TL-2023a]